MARSIMALATFAALAAGTTGVSALDNMSNFAGSDSLKEMTDDVLVECGANCAGLHYVGNGEERATDALNSGIQSVAPMTHPLGNGAFRNSICLNANRTKAEGLVVALDQIRQQKEAAA